MVLMPKYSTTPKREYAKRHLLTQRASPLAKSTREFTRPIHHTNSILSTYGERCYTVGLCRVMDFIPQRILSHMCWLQWQKNIFLLIFLPIVMQKVAEIDAAADSIPPRTPSIQSFTVLSHSAATVRQRYWKCWNCLQISKGKNLKAEG